MRSVTHMFDHLITWFTPERRDRTLFRAEIAVGVFLALALMLDQTWRGGSFFAIVVSNVVALLLGFGVAVHRTRPHWAVVALGASVFVGLLATVLIGPPNNALIFLAAAVVTFGSSAYGNPATRWFGLGLSVLAAIGLALVFVIGAGLYVNVSLGYVLARIIEILIWPVISLMPWVLGELVRSIRNRRVLSAAVKSVSTERDAALTRADLEAERTRVARDVHDIVAHSLTVVIAQADGARYATTADSPAAADAFGTIAQTARDALADVRTLLTELRHTQEAGPQPGLANLDALFDSFRDSGLELNVHEFGERGRLTDARELALYRIAQESLTNALRHGDGRATLDLDWSDATVDLLVTNQAAATSARSTPPNAEPATDTDTAAATLSQPGHGIDGMRERSILAGGEFSIHEGATYRVRARLPREPREHPRAEARDSEGVVTEVHA
ncbi:signal transduction histidine kinase [Microcella alkaliphila]|uniref:histidine kinase n=2 Tax=Microcella alkaliphila TaxID=279828 RepID=A0A4Q7TSI8_9MICO|nr:signal transduction histidine kinase [Microcella alkaliphila]